MYWVWALGSGVIGEAELQELRQQYTAAYAACQSCGDALIEASASGQPVSRELREKEARLQRELKEARKKYRDALLEIAFPEGAATHVCDRKGRPEIVVDESRDRPITGIFPTCSVCGAPQV